MKARRNKSLGGEAHDKLDQLVQQYKDTIFDVGKGTKGAGQKRLLDKHGLKRWFD